MKVYYEIQPHPGEEVFDDAYAMAKRYKTLTGNTPNKIVLTRREFRALDQYFNQYPEYELGKARGDVFSLHGMEIKVEG